LEFPLFLNALAASPIRIAVEKGGLPHGTPSVEVEAKNYWNVIGAFVISSVHRDIKVPAPYCDTDPKWTVGF